MAEEKLNKFYRDYDKIIEERERRKKEIAALKREQEITELNQLEESASEEREMNEPSLPQQPEESDSAYRERRKKEEWQKENLRKNGYLSAYLNKQKKQGADAPKKQPVAQEVQRKFEKTKKQTERKLGSMKRQVLANPNVKKTISGAKDIEERKQAIQKQLQRAKDRLNIKKAAAGKAAKFASQTSKIAAQAIKQGLTRAIAWLGGLAIGATVGTISATSIIILIMIIIIVAIAQTCSDNAINSTVCNGISEITSWL